MLKYEPMYSNLREVSKRFHFPAGNYCIIPTTFRMGEEGEFLIRTFVEKYWGSSDQGDKQSFREGVGVRGRGERSDVKARPLLAAAAPIHDEENGGDICTGKTRERKRFV